MLERTKKTYRLNGRMYMRGYSGSIKFKTQAGIKDVFKKIHSAIKKIGPKIVHGAKKVLDFAASDPTVSQMIKNAANQVLEGSGDKVVKALQTTNNMVKDKKIDVNKIKDIALDAKDLIKQWKDNNKKVQDAPTIKSAVKEQVAENTKKLEEAAEKGRLGAIAKLKNANYLNLLTKSTRGGSISPSASVIKEIRDALNLPATPIAQKGRMFLGELKPRYLVSQITGSEYPPQQQQKQKPQQKQQPPDKKKKGRLAGVAGHDKSMPPPTKKDGEKGDIVKKFEALF